MKYFLLLLTTLSAAVFADNDAFWHGKIMNEISSIMAQHDLVVIAQGESKPYIDEEGTFVFRLGSDPACSDQFCEAMLVSISKTSSTECIKDLPKQAIGTLPIVLADQSTGYFTIPTLTDKEANNKDFFVFYQKATGHCYELAYGHGGAEFKNLQGIANYLLGVK